MSDIRKRMAHVKAALKASPVYLKSDRRRMEELSKEMGHNPRKWDEFYAIKVTRVTDEHWDALERAKEYFGVKDDHHAALAMAMVLFGRHGKGRSRDTKTWTYQKYLHFAEACSELRAKDNSLSDAEICRAATWIVTSRNMIPTTCARSSQSPAVPPESISRTWRQWRQRTDRGL
jgi:hypothetical protein